VEYIVIDPETFEVSVADRPPTAPALVTPVYDIYTLNAEPPLLAEVGAQEIADAYERELEREGTGALPVLPSPPDAFLVALILMMWEGIVQGMTWDMVKPYVFRALHVLQERGLAPSEHSSEHSISETKLGFFYTSYAKDEGKLEELFFGLSRRHERMSRREREEVTESARAPWNEITEDTEEDRT
jgi:hypothetical protein